jgi:hypothetical protein
MKTHLNKIAGQFGCTPAQVAAQFAKNKKQLTAMADQAADTGKKVNGFTELQLRINAAIVGTPKSAGTSRANALASIEWVLKEACGLYVGMKNLQTALVEKAEASVFDGRDNEAMKLKYFTALTGGNFTIELL